MRYGLEIFLTFTEVTEEKPLCGTFCPPPPPKKNNNNNSVPPVCNLTASELTASELFLKTT